MYDLKYVHIYTVAVQWLAWVVGGWIKTGSGGYFSCACSTIVIVGI